MLRLSIHFVVALLGWYSRACHVQAKARLGANSDSQLVTLDPRAAPKLLLCTSVTDVASVEFHRSDLVHIFVMGSE
jgi:hypothetical protein